MTEWNILCYKYYLWQLFKLLKELSFFSVKDWCAVYEFPSSDFEHSMYCNKYICTNITEELAVTIFKEIICWSWKQQVPP
jgi:hypothetical protein